MSANQPNAEQSEAGPGATCPFSRKCSTCGRAGHNSRTCLDSRDTALPAGHEGENADAGISEQPAVRPSQTEREDDDDEAATDDSAVAPPREGRKKGVAWTEEEHRHFLLGLQKLGKGDWRGISRHFVHSRSATQVASHAQKYFIRQSVAGKRKRRASLFDLVPEQNTDDEGAPPGESTEQRGEAQQHQRLPRSGVPPESLPQGPEVQAMAFWYQAMLTQQNPAAWMPALYGPGQWGLPPQMQGLSHPGQAYPSSPGPQQMSPYGCGRQPNLTPGQAFASYVMHQQQQHLAAAISLGAVPFGPGFPLQQCCSSAGAAQLPHSGSTGPPAEGPHVGYSAMSSNGEERKRVKSDAAQPVCRPLSGSMSATEQTSGDESGHVSAGEFSRITLIRPKAHKAGPGDRFGEMPAYMTASLPELREQRAAGSGESQQTVGGLAWGEGAGERRAPATETSRLTCGAATDASIPGHDEHSITFGP